ADDLTVSPTERLGQQLTLHAPAPSAAAEPRSAASAQLYRSERGLIAVARDLASAGAEAVSFQGFDWPRKAWSYLQGGSFVVPASGLHGNIALVSLNGADLSPFDRCFPVLHWPLARVRAGLDERAGAVLLLRGRRDFELDPDPDRLVAKWRWGDPVLGVIAEEQRARQWSLMDAPPAAFPLRQVAAKELLRLVAGDALPEAFVLRAASGPPNAVLVHWPRLRFLAMVAGESLSAGTGTLFLSTDVETRIEIGLADGVRGLRVHRPGKSDTVFLPLGSGRPGER
ncbi:MAG: hypothetical protein Q8M65_00940, partial [Rhodoglobus sp.]|nr:hypothetical protein [Rhodoglobus sp.]